MVFKFFLIFFLSINLSYANVIYEKNEIIITEIDYLKYLDIYVNTYGEALSKNHAIKNIVLIKKTITALNRNNPDYIVNLDNHLEKQFGKDIFKDKTTIDIFRFMRLKNDFITNYYLNDFNINDLSNIFYLRKEMIFPISQNQCLTLDKMEDLRNDSYFVSNFYQNLKNNLKNFQTSINGKIYDVCIDKKNFEIIQKSILKFIEKKIENNFNQFIYENVY